MRFLPVTAGALLVELPDLPRTLALLRALQAGPPEGVTEVIPAARTLLIHYEPWRLDDAQLAAAVAAIAQKAESAAQSAAESGAPPEEAAGALMQIPVRYDGEDLAEVAAHLGLSAAQVIARHTAQPWQVAFAGFAPGFAYLSGGDAVFDVPRRASPRTRIPPGAVALAGRFSGVYPRASPGGWQLIGQTEVPMWDLARTPPALLQPGQRVQFVDAATEAGRELLERWRAPSRCAVAASSSAPDSCAPDGGGDGEAPVLEVLAPGLQALVQDLGRPGQAGQGVSASGALDRGAFLAANRLVGNHFNAPALELLHGGFTVRALGPAVVAVTGAEGPLTLRRQDGAALPAARHAPLALQAGDTLALGAPEAGLRSYLAARGGFAAQPVLGSCASDTLAGIGPAPLAAGQRLGLGRRESRHGPLASVAAHPEAASPHLPRPGDAAAVWLDITLGPRADWFSPQALALLLEQPWQVTPQSNRVGLRLAGSQPLQRAAAFEGAELPSEGTALGALQVPANGQPVLFLADHPLTGGYPVVGCVAAHHLDLAAQLPTGTLIRFRAQRPFQEICLS